jgi:uncharacterized integral membrane protein
MTFAGRPRRGTADAPIWIVLVLAAIGGVIIGSLLRFRRRHNH